MQDVTLIAVFAAGIISFLSPCVLPLVPPYLSYMAGTSFEQLTQGVENRAAIRRRTLFASLFFVLGFSIVFVSAGAAATVLGQTIRPFMPVLTKIAGVLIILMGLHFIGLIRIRALYNQLRLEGPKNASGPLGGFLLGFAFAFGWTPCIGPILGPILTTAATEDTAWRGAGLLAVYSAGLGVPFVLAALALGPFMKFFDRFKRHLGMVEKVMGVLLVITGILFITGDFSRMSYWMLEVFPGLANLG